MDELIFFVLLESYTRKVGLQVLPVAVRTREITWTSGGWRTVKPITMYQLCLAVHLADNTRGCW
jgi:hypothetical protein